MIESLIKADQECTTQRDVNPGKVLRPIGTRFREWCENRGSTDPPCYLEWKVVDHYESFKGRRGDTILFERMEEVALV